MGKWSAFRTLCSLETLQSISLSGSQMGRTARAGREGRVTLLVGPDEALLGDAIRSALDAGAPLEGVFSRRRSLAKKARKYGGFVARGVAPGSPSAPRQRASWKKEDPASEQSRAGGSVGDRKEAEPFVPASAGWERAPRPATPRQAGRPRKPTGAGDERRAERLGLGETGSRRASMASWMKKGSRRGAQDSGPWISAGFERSPQSAAAAPDRGRRRHG
ncbi:hypothetical protein H632_c3717p0 [Helicosporidium sp. ATCC 50920]|nr:hypothetical protein H632_c3717p0 [Helicosporidium sp. ATCC 50920]|eukprot:KDD72195.1 hypothetical protein H632_c3717p0 [Helicosporidium sp. ATCC 50920]